MKTIINTVEIPELPFTLADGVKSAIKTMALTHKIQSDLANGMTIENVIASHLPAEDKDKVHIAAQELEAAVSDYYTSLEDNVDDAWVTKMLNNGMLNLDNSERIKYLKNLIEMLTDGDLDSNKRAAIDNIDENASDEDVAFLLDVARTAIANHSDILCRASVQAMVTSLNKISENTIHQLTNAGVDHAKAYATACYLLYRCGEKPWISDETITNEPDPYSIGTIAAASTEASKTMALYYQGKVAVDKMKQKMVSIFRRAITFVSRHTVRAIALVIQVAFAVKTAKILARFLLLSLHFAPWAAVIGSVALGLLFATKVITTQDLVNILNSVWNGVKAAWNAVKHLFGSLFGTTAAAEAEAEADIEEEASEETNEENEENDEEDSEDLIP